jgi:hypothetical protein
MKAITATDVMKEIDSMIDANPAIIEIQLDSHETKEFLLHITRLVQEGMLKITSGFNNNYIYRSVPIIVTHNVLFG